MPLVFPSHSLHLSPLSNEPTNTHLTVFLTESIPPLPAVTPRLETTPGPSPPPELKTAGSQVPDLSGPTKGSNDTPRILPKRPLDVPTVRAGATASANIGCADSSLPEPSVPPSNTVTVEATANLETPDSSLAVPSPPELSPLPNVIRECALKKLAGIAGSGRSVALVHCVSSDLAMRKGFAPQVVAKFGRPMGPVQAYPSVLVQHSPVDHNVVILHLVTKDKVENKPTLADLTTALSSALSIAVDLGVECVVMPRIGCKRDKLEWSDVGPMIHSVASTVAPSIHVHVTSRPTNTEASSDSSSHEHPSNTHGPFALRDRFHQRRAALALRRRPMSLPERQATAIAAFALHRTIRHAQAKDETLFPLRLWAPLSTTMGSDVSTEGLLDATLGIDSRPTTPESRWTPPSSPGPESEVEGVLPQSLDIISEIATAVAAEDPLSAVGAPVDLPWKSGARIPAGRWTWGPTLDPARWDRDKRAVLRELLRKELAIGAVQPVTDMTKVALVTPIFVAYHPVTMKARLVHDLRPLNSRLLPATAKYDRIFDALAHKMRVCTKIDLSTAFKHVELSEEAASMMAFQVGGAVFRWTRLPFGMSWSPSFFQDVLAPTIEKVRRQGVVVVIYVDDLLILAMSPQELDAALAVTIRALTSDGWRIAPNKSYAWAHTQIIFLGLLLNLSDQSIRVPVHKATKLSVLVNAALTGKKVTLAHLQKITGLLSFFLAAVPTIGIAWSAIRSATVEASGTSGRHVAVVGGLKHELSFWSKAAAQLPSWKAWKPGDSDDMTLVTDASDVGWGAVAWKCGSGPAPVLADWVAGRPLGTEVDTAADSFTPAQSAEASAVRELLALKYALQRLILASRSGAPGTRTPELGGTLAPELGGQRRSESRADRRGSDREADHTDADLPQVGSKSALDSPAGGVQNKNTSPALSPLNPLQSLGSAPESTASPPRTIRWLCDSTAAVASLCKWRSTSAALTQVIGEIVQLVCKHGLVIRPKWVSREHNWLPAADFLSRTVGRANQAEWSLQPGTFRRFCRLFDLRPTRDMFATPSNTQTPDFCSLEPHPRSRGDALASPWPRCAYAFPPFSLIPRALTAWRHSAPPGADLLLVAPDLPNVRLFFANEVMSTQLWPPGARLVDHRGVTAKRLPPTPLLAFHLRRRECPPAPGPSSAPSSSPS